MWDNMLLYVSLSVNDFLTLNKAHVALKHEYYTRTTLNCFIKCLCLSVCGILRVQFVAKKKGYHFNTYPHCLKKKKKEKKLKIKEK